MKRNAFSAVAFAGVLLSMPTVNAGSSAAPVLPLVRGGESRTGMFRADNGSVAEKFADASVTWAEDGLEVRIRRRLEPGETAGAIGTQENPSSIFGGGGVTVEMLVAPHPDEPDVFYQFAVNPSNVLYQARLFDVKWRPARPVTSRVFFGKGEWGATFRIPFGAFGEAPVADGTEWKADFGCGRLDWAGVPTRHDPSAYGTLRFGTAAQRAYVENVTRGADGFVHVTYAVRPGSGDAEVPHKALADSSLSLSANGTPVADVHFAANGADPDHLALDHYYYRPGEDIVYSAKGFGKGSTVTVRRLADGQAVQTVASEGVGTLSGVRFEPGEYAFEIADAVQYTACQFEVADEVGASALTNGSAFGIASFDPKVLVADFGDRKALPFYPILGSALFRGSLGIRGALSLKYVTKPQAGYLVDPANLLPKAEAAFAQGQGGGVTLNRLAYEAQIKILVPGEDGRIRPVPSQGEFFMNAYRTLKAKFPDRIISLQTDSPSAVAELAPACDVLEFAGGGSYGANPLLRIRSSLDLARKASGEKPIVFWLGGALPEKGARRSADEANTAIRYCILRGVSGTVFHMGHGGVPESRTRLWSFLRGAERAVNAWYPAWVTGKAVDVAAACEEGVEVGARKTSAGWILIAVNLDPHRRSFAFTDPSTGARRTIRLTGFGSVVVANDPQ